MARLIDTLLFAAALVACANDGADPRQVQITAVLAAADEPLIRSRPALAAGKYARMASSPMDWFRGSLSVYRSDARSGTTTVSVSRFGLDVPLVPSLGDPHPENFGILRAGDGSLAFEPNDFDTADRAPYLWDLRRLASGMALATSLANADSQPARERALTARRAIVREAIMGYERGVEVAARGPRRERITRGVSGGAIVEDLFRRSERDLAARAELVERTIVDQGRRRLVRGRVDEDDPQKIHAELPDAVMASLPEAIERYRRSLVLPPPPEFFTLLDAVRSFGKGVGSWPRVRVILLVRGPSDDAGDDVMLELKELFDSGIAGLFPPGLYHDDVGRRIVETSRAAWARADAEALWGVTSWLGLPCHIRLESEGQKGVRVDRLVGSLGTPDALADLARLLGELAARVHTSAPNGLELARAIYARIAVDPDGFLEEQTEVGLAYADQVLEDHARFVRALYDVGFRLGLPFDPADSPRADFAALLGSPPEPRPLPPRP